ncbi:hypothetical protein EJ08DRAFT_353016 [Tothia fuscella]|uniref:Uncharacterized protein n=1 Tax=Tothia fuscella TaxID=1048955 RepID=A0A9P4NMB0_9PEZI|nr:hypothetical protein EJ08DRAFT_353016 [Tothia fuscella]
MPPKQTRDNSANSGKPLVPALATDRIKSPITPRLAAHHLGVGNVSTPLSRRAARSNTPDTIKGKPPPKEDLATPVKNLISTNITPRSSSRKSRVGTSSNNSTPNGTPNGTPNTSRPTSMVEGPGNGKRVAGNSVLSPGSRPQSVTAGNYAATTSPHLGSSTFPGAGNRSLHSPREMGSKFFHASDAGSIQETISPPPTKSAFFYANGVREDVPNRALNSPSPPLSAVSGRSHRSQFFRADGSTDDDDGYLPPVPPIPSPPKITTSPSVYQHSASPFHSLPGFRPPSPQKDNFHLSYRKGASQIIRPDDRLKTVSILPPATFDVPKQRRSSSSESSKIRKHGRASSLSSIESANSTRKPSLAALDTCGLTPIHGLINANNDSLSSSAPPSARVPSPIYESDDPTNAISAAIKESTAGTRSRQTSMSTAYLPQSPVRASSGLPAQNVAQLTELAANARRERKVLDLEISNSSLLAINRQLEREVKKQKTELRRFRRLSRAGRLSTRTGDGELDGQAESNTLPGLSEEEEGFGSEDYSDEDDMSASGSSSAEDSSLSPSALAEQDSRKLAKDSKRLKLDLHKHRELLVDSQKMNQSLKRCMTWTEEMLLEGRRALEYKVRVSDIKLGGRVLERDVPEEEEGEEAEADHSLLSPWTPSSRPEMELADGMLGLGLDMIHGRKSWQSEEADSGVEVESVRGSAIMAHKLELEIQELIADMPMGGSENPPD